MPRGGSVLRSQISSGSAVGDPGSGDGNPGGGNAGDFGSFGAFATSTSTSPMNPVSFVGIQAKKKSLEDFSVQARRTTKGSEPRGPWTQSTTAGRGGLLTWAHGHMRPYPHEGPLDRLIGGEYLHIYAFAPFPLV